MLVFHFHIEIWYLEFLKGGFMGTILLIVLILLLVGALPTWGYSSSWGYGPGGLSHIPGTPANPPY